MAFDINRRFDKEDALYNVFFGSPIKRRNKYVEAEQSSLDYDPVDYLRSQLSTDSNMKDEGTISGVSPTGEVNISGDDVEKKGKHPLYDDPAFMELITRTSSITPQQQQRKDRLQKASAISAAFQQLGNIIQGFEGAKGASIPKNTDNTSSNINAMLYNLMNQEAERQSVGDRITLNAMIRNMEDEQDRERYRDDYKWKLDRDSEAYEKKYGEGGIREGYNESKVLFELGAKLQDKKDYIEYLVSTNRDPQSEIEAKAVIEKDILREKARIKRELDIEAEERMRTSGDGDKPYIEIYQDGNLNKPVVAKIEKESDAVGLWTDAVYYYTKNPKKTPEGLELSIPLDQFKTLSKPEQLKMMFKLYKTDEFKDKFKKVTSSTEESKGTYQPARQTPSQQNVSEDNREAFEYNPNEDITALFGFSKSNGDSWEVYEDVLRQYFRAVKVEVEGKPLDVDAFLEKEKKRYNK